MAHDVELTPRQVFDRIADSDTTMTREELEQAVGMLGPAAGVLLNDEFIGEAWDRMDSFGRGEIPFQVFERWWKGLDHAQLAPQRQRAVAQQQTDV